MFHTIVGAGAVGARAGAASHYSSGSDQKMRLLAAPCGSSSGSATLTLTLLKVNFKILQEH
jgi:hypothetical protein